MPFGKFCLPLSGAWPGYGLEHDSLGYGSARFAMRFTAALIPVTPIEQNFTKQTRRLGEQENLQKLVAAPGAERQALCPKNEPQITIPSAPFKRQPLLAVIAIFVRQRRSVRKQVVLILSDQQCSSPCCRAAIRRWSCFFVIDDRASRPLFANIRCEARHAFCRRLPQGLGRAHSQRCSRIKCCRSIGRPGPAMPLPVGLGKQMLRTIAG